MLGKLWMRGQRKWAFPSSMCHAIIQRMKLSLLKVVSHSLHPTNGNRYKSNTMKHCGGFHSGNNQILFRNNIIIKHHNFIHYSATPR